MLVFLFLFLVLICLKFVLLTKKQKKNTFETYFNMFGLCIHVTVYWIFDPGPQNQSQGSIFKIDIYTSSEI